MCTCTKEIYTYMYMILRYVDVVPYRKCCQSIRCLWVVSRTVLECENSCDSLKYSRLLHWKLEDALLQVSSEENDLQCTWTCTWMFGWSGLELLICRTCLQRTFIAEQVRCSAQVCPSCRTDQIECISAIQIRSSFCFQSDYGGYLYHLQLFKMSEPAWWLTDENCISEKCVSPI